MMPSINSQKLWSRVCVCLDNANREVQIPLLPIFPSRYSVSPSHFTQSKRSDTFLPSCSIQYPMQRCAKIPFQSRLSRGQSFCFESAKVQLNCVRKHCHTSR